MPRFLPLLLAALAVGACDDEPVDPAQTEVVPEADVERFRAEVFQETLDLDADIARLEADVAATDSTVRAAYGPALDGLRDDRRRLQVRVDSLRPVARASFDSTRTAVAGQISALRQSVRRVRFEAAPTYAALEGAVARELGRLDVRLAALRPAAEADTTGALRTDIDSLAADRARLSARLGAYPDTSASQFPPFRTAVTNALLRLEARADDVAPDTISAPRRTAPDDER